METQSFRQGRPIPNAVKCAAQEYKQMMAQIAKIEDGKVLGTVLAAEWQRVQDKAKLVLEGSKK